MFGNNDGFTKHPTKSTTVINEPPSSVLPLIYLNMCDSFLGQHLALLFVTLRYTWWLKRAATTAEASAVCTFSFAKAYTVTCLVESLCGVFTPGCTRLTNVKLSQAFKELVQWQESTSMTTPEGFVFEWKRWTNIDVHGILHEQAAPRDGYERSDPHLRGSASSASALRWISILNGFV